MCQHVSILFGISFAILQHTCGTHMEWFHADKNIKYEKSNRLKHKLDYLLAMDSDKCNSQIF